MQRAVRGVDEVHGPEPGVRRRHELHARIRRRKPERDAVGRDGLPVHDIVGHLAHERLAVVLFRIRRAAVDRDAGGGGHRPARI
ncbi:MAG: hypothetical protein ACK55I_08175, partial [bacterium]